MENHSYITISQDGIRRKHHVGKNGKNRTTKLCTGNNNECPNDAKADNLCTGCKSGRHRDEAGARKEGEIFTKDGIRYKHVGGQSRKLCTGNDNTCNKIIKRDNLCDGCISGRGKISHMGLIEGQVVINHGRRYRYNGKALVLLCSGDNDTCPKYRDKDGLCHLHYHDGSTWSHRFNTETFIVKARAAHGDKYDYSKVTYTKNSEHVTIIYPFHGEFQQKPSDHLSRSGTGKFRGCNMCRKSRPKDQQYWLGKAAEIHGDMYDYSLVKYTGSKQNVTIICRIHGPFEQKSEVHLTGCGCPTCNHSQGELAVAKYLAAIGEHYEQQKKFDDCRNIHKLPFDFFLPKYNALIEFDGKQHYKIMDFFGGEEGFRKIQFNDNIKNEFAARTNRPLLRIRYNENIETAIDTFIMQTLDR